MKKQVQQRNNCLLATAFLLRRHRTAGLALLSSHTRWFPWHFVVLTERRMTPGQKDLGGHALHYIWGGRWAGCIPFWFDGSFVGVRRSRLQAELKASGRTLVKVEFRRWAIWFRVGGLIAILAIPWLLGWLISVPLRPVWWAVNGWAGGYERRGRRTVGED